MKFHPKILITFLCFFFGIYFIVYTIGCYSLFPSYEIDNGNPNDPGTWKLYQLKWKAGTNPELENALHKYYSDCNPGCVDEYILNINLLDDIDLETLNEINKSKNTYKAFKYAKSIYLIEVDTCGSNNCSGTAIPWAALDGDTRQLIKNANAVKIRIYVNSDETSDPRTWKYFKIFVRTVDNEIFLSLQKELFIEPPLESFTLVVNILDANRYNQYIVIGDEADPGASKYSWSQLSKKVKDGLINWSEKNKENLSYFRYW